MGVSVSVHLFLFSVFKVFIDFNLLPAPLIAVFFSGSLTLFLPFLFLSLFFSSPSSTERASTKIRLHCRLLAGWSAHGRLAGWLAGWLVSWLLGELIDWLLTLFLVSNCPLFITYSATVLLSIAIRFQCNWIRSCLNNWFLFWQYMKNSFYVFIFFISLFSPGN